MLLAHASGATSVVDCSYASRLPRENFPETLLEVEGTEGSLRLDAGYRLTVFAGGETREIDAAPPLLPWAERPWHNIQESVLAIQRHFLECLERGASPRPPAPTTSDAGAGLRGLRVGSRRRAKHRDGGHRVI